MIHGDPRTFELDYYVPETSGQLMKKELWINLLVFIVTRSVIEARNESLAYSSGYDPTDILGEIAQTDPRPKKRFTNLTSFPFGRLPIICSRLTSPDEKWE